MSIKNGKLWGTTTEILAIGDQFEQHCVEANAGYECSEHYHEYKINWFYVLRGSLLIRRWKENNVVDETILHKNEQTLVPPNEWHQFEALSDCTFLEAYWPYYKKIDIIRRTQGGKSKKAG